MTPEEAFNVGVLLLLFASLFTATLQVVTCHLTISALLILRLLAALLLLLMVAKFGIVVGGGGRFLSRKLSIREALLAAVRNTITLAVGTATVVTIEVLLLLRAEVAGLVGSLKALVGLLRFLVRCITRATLISALILLVLHVHTMIQAVSL